MPWNLLHAILTQTTTLTARFNTLEKGQSEIMAGISDIKKAQAAEQADIVTLSGLVTQLLAAFANGSLSPADAQALLDATQADDATVKSSIASIQAALPVPPAAPAV